ncbi:MAG: hypothetical protein E7588_05535 [Ruminococcaceae bacterium]|nr:hypothetical protein [Oscillospiraceae bacterium]
MAEKSQAQLKFDIAYDSYKQVEAVVKELSELTQIVFRHFSHTIAMRQYDYMLQLLLLSMAVADDDYKNLENQFVEKITRYGSILTSYNISLKDKGSDTKYTWQSLREHINSLSGDEKSAFVGDLYSLISHRIKEFVDFFACIDQAVKGRNFLAEINFATENILRQFAIIDETEDVNPNDPGTAAFSELELALELKAEIFTEKWLQVISECE